MNRSRYPPKSPGDRWREFRRWLKPGLRIKRWLALLGFGIIALSLALAQLLIALYRDSNPPGWLQALSLQFLPHAARVIVGLVVGLLSISIAIYELNRSLLAPLTRLSRAPLIDLMSGSSQKGKDKALGLVAIGGGTGLPSVLRGMKRHTSNITAIVTVADDGGSSGRLRRELGVLPPGDLRNNIAALADDEDLMTQLFQYRFAEGGLEGHSFGNLFLTALADITGSMDQALVETGRVLSIQGRVLPSTLQDVTLMAEIRDLEGKLYHVAGESQIPEAGGKIERVFLSPENARPYPETIRAILNADLIVIGPGSLYTSILPNLLIDGIPEAIRASTAICVYVCNIATQKGETEGFTVAEHVEALERHIGRGVFQAILANNSYPTRNAGAATYYVMPAPPDHPVRQRYHIYETDLTDPQRPWRHQPDKLTHALQHLLAGPIVIEPGKARLPV